MENEIPRLSPVWDHSLTTILGHDPTTEPGIALRHWIHFQGVLNLLDLLSWDQEELKSTPAVMILPVISLFSLRSSNSITQTLQ